MIDKIYVHEYNNYCSVEKQEHARVAQWWSIALPRRGSRVRIPSRAFFVSKYMIADMPDSCRKPVMGIYKIFGEVYPKKTG